MILRRGGLLSQVPQKRRVFFSFHYQLDIWRANQVRQSWRFRREGEREAEGFFDGSLWESSRRQGEESLKALIRQGMKNTSVTCVLAGIHTYLRRWVRYEIARSIVKGNGLITVHIHRLEDRQGVASYAGPNPLDYMGVYRTNDGRILVAEVSPQGQWVAYGDYTQAVELPAQWPAPRNTHVVPLSRYARCYDYVADAGSANFSGWVSAAAAAVGR